VALLVMGVGAGEHGRLRGGGKGDAAVQAGGRDKGKPAGRVGGVGKPLEPPPPFSLWVLPCQ
jgi:hypothetical protein